MATVPQPDDSGLGIAASAVCILVIALAAISVALRFYTRLSTRLGLWWDDWLILAAVITTSTCAALVLSGNRIDPSGSAVSASTDPTYIYTPEDTIYMKLSYAASILYFTIAGTTKLGILLMYIRIFYISNGFRTQVIVASTIVLAYWITCTIATLLVCRPMTYVWTSASGFPRYCFNYNVFWMSAGVFELLLDVMILAMPIRAVMSMHLSPRKKTSVAGIFLLGGFVIITGIVKVILAYSPGGHIPLYGAADVWVTLHAGMAIVCACLPIMKPLFVRCTGASLSTVNSSTRTAEPDGWNIIHLDVDNGTSDCSIYSLTPGPKSGFETPYRGPRDDDSTKSAFSV